MVARRQGGTAPRDRLATPSVAAYAVRCALAPPVLAPRQGARFAFRRELGGRTLPVRRRQRRLRGRLPTAPPHVLASQPTSARALTTRSRRLSRTVPAAPAWFPDGSRLPAARHRTPKRRRTNHCVRPASLGSNGVETGTVVAPRNLHRRWMLELRRWLTCHRRGTIVSDRCFSCMASSLRRVSSARWQLDSAGWDIALMTSTLEGSSVASTHGR